MTGLDIEQPGSGVVQQMEAALSSAIPGAAVRVRGSGGHFEIEVVSAAFEGGNRLQRQRMVLGAIAPLMKGENAPVHAVDRIVAVTPDEMEGGS